MFDDETVIHLIPVGDGTFIEINKYSLMKRIGYIPDKHYMDEYLKVDIRFGQIVDTGRKMFMRDLKNNKLLL